MVYDRSLTNRSRRTDCFSRMELSNISAESVCNYYLFPVCRPHLPKQPLKSRRQGIFLFTFYSNLLDRVAQGPFVRMYPQQVSVTSRPKRERQFFLSPTRLSQAGSRLAAANHAMPVARLQTRAPNIAANVLNPLRRRQQRGAIRTHPRTLRGVTS